MPEAHSKIQVDMVLERSTHGTHLFKSPMQQSAAVRNVYVQKDAFDPAAGLPKKIRVTVEVLETY